MKVLHISQNTDGYEEVTLIANRVNRNNHLSVIEKDKIRYFTGGILMEDCKKVRNTLDNIPKKEQYNFVLKFKIEPFKKSYLKE